MILNTILFVNSLLIPPLGFLLNFTLLWLIIHRTPKEMWLHSRVLLQTCILDILLLIVFLIAIPYSTYFGQGDCLIIFDGYLIQFDLFRQLFSDPMYLRILFLIWHFFFNFDILAIAVQFIYRYLVLNRSIKITIFQYLLFLTVPLFCSILITSAIYFQIEKPLLNNSIDFSNIFIESNGNIIFAAFELNKSANKISMFIFTLLYLLSYCVIIFCGRQMVKYVADNAMHERLKELNKQLTKSLIISACYPLISEAFIALFFITSIFIPSSLVNEGLFLTIILNWLPILNPLASLWTFRPYREALMAPFKKATIHVTMVQQFAAELY